MAYLTIHTATYNRAYILTKAYESLQAQTCKNFEWIITDDGSSDNTEELVLSWIASENDFPIIYNKLQHVGIPRALNSGVSLASTKWFMMLDSDDCFHPSTVENTIGWLSEIENDDVFAGIGFAKSLPDGRYMKDQIPAIDPRVGYVDATTIERANYNLNMDMEEVTRVELFRKYPFQYWPTEEYAPEQLNYYEIAFAGYRYRWFDAKLCICSYLPDGQTRDNRLVMRNPMGFAMMYNQNILLSKSFSQKVRHSMQMIALSLYAGEPSYLFRSNDKLATFLALPLGSILAIRRSLQFSKHKRNQS